MINGILFLIFTVAGVCMLFHFIREIDQEQKNDSRG